MKNIILLTILTALLTSCYALEMGNYRNCSYNEEDGLYYDWREYPQKMPCKALNKNKRQKRTAKSKFRCPFHYFSIFKFLIKEL